MMDNNLTKEDMNILIDAVDAWQNKDSNSEFMVSMLSTMLAKDKQDAERILKERSKEQEKKKALQDLKKEKATLLKAKLIEIKNSMNVEHLLEDSK